MNIKISNFKHTVVSVIFAFMCVSSPSWSSGKYINKLQILQNEYGLKITLPSSWSETPYGTMHSKKYLFSYIWHPPLPAKLNNSRAELLIRISSSPISDILPLRFGYQNILESEIINSNGRFIDLKNGGSLKDGQKKVIPISIRNEKNRLVGMWFATAFIVEDGITESGVNLFTERYMIQVRLFINENDYPSLSNEFYKILKSVEIFSNGWRKLGTRN